MISFTEVAAKLTSRASSRNVFLMGVAALSLAFGSFWYIRAAADYTYAEPPLFFVLVFGPSVASILLLFGVTRSAVPLRLPPEADRHPLALPLVLASACAYLLLLPVFWALGRGIVESWQNPRDPEASVFVALLVLYIPPWWAPLFGSICTWLWIRRRVARLE